MKSPPRYVAARRFVPTLGCLAAMTMACGTPPTLAAARVTTPVMVGPVKYLGPTEPERGTQPTEPISVEVYQTSISWVMPSSSDRRSNSMTVGDMEKASKVDTEIIRATKMDDAYDVHIDRIHTRGRYWNALVVSKVVQGAEIEGNVVSIAGGESNDPEPSEDPPAEEPSDAPATDPVTEGSADDAP